MGLTSAFFVRVFSVIIFILGSMMVPTALLMPQQLERAATAAFHEEVIGELSPGSRIQMALSAAGHLAWVETQGGKQTVRLDGKQQGDIYGLVKNLDFSPDGQHLAFAGWRTGRGNFKQVLVLDGQERSPEYSEMTSFAWQPKGNSLAYCACREKRCRLVVDGAERGAEYENISSPQYTSDGRRIAYLAMRGGKWVAVVDGREIGPELDAYWDWGFSRDGSRFYVASRIKDNWTYVVDGTAGPGFDTIRFDTISRIAFSPDGKHHAYGGAEVKYGKFTKSKTRGALVLDGRLQGTFEGSAFGGFLQGVLQRTMGVSDVIISGPQELDPNFYGVGNPDFTAEGKLVYAARRGKGDVVVFVGDQAGPGFEEIVSPIIFTPYEKHFAYTTKQGKLVYAARRAKGDVAVFIADQAGPGFEEIASPIVFTPDEKHFAYITKQGDYFVEVRDNQPGNKFTGKRMVSFVGWITMSEDGAHLAYSIVRGGVQFAQGRSLRALCRVVVDGQPGPEYDAISVAGFQFSQDRKHYGYEVHGVEGYRSRAVVDGNESKLYDDVASDSVVFADKMAWFFARDGQKFLRVSYPAP